MECSMSKYHSTDWLIWLIATNNIFEKKKTQFRRLNEIYLMDDVASCTNITQFSLIIWVMYVCLHLIWKRLIFFIWNNGM